MNKKGSKLSKQQQQQQQRRSYSVWYFDTFIGFLCSHPFAIGMNGQLNWLRSLLLLFCYTVLAKNIWKAVNSFIVSHFDTLFNVSSFESLANLILLVNYVTWMHFCSYSHFPFTITLFILTSHVISLIICEYELILLFEY